MNKLTAYEIDQYEKFMKEQEEKEERELLEIIEKEVKREYQNEIKRMKQLFRKNK